MLFFWVEIQISTTNSLSVDELFTLDLVCWLALGSLETVVNFLRRFLWRFVGVIPRSATLGSLDSKRSELLEENELLKEIPGTWMGRVGGSLSGNLGVMGMAYQVVIYEGWLLFFSEDKLDKFEGRLLMVLYGMLTRTAGENLIEL